MEGDPAVINRSSTIAPEAQFSFGADASMDEELTENQSSLMVPFFGDVTEAVIPDNHVSATDARETKFILQPVLRNHIASFGRYVFGANEEKHPNISAANKKQKVDNIKPMDQDFIYPDL